MLFAENFTQSAKHYRDFSSWVQPIIQGPPCWDESGQCWLQMNSLLQKHTFVPDSLTHTRCNPISAQSSNSKGLQITASVLFVYFFIKAYILGIHLNCINFSYNSNEYPQHMLLKRKSEKKIAKTSSNKC